MKNRLVLRHPVALFVLTGCVLLAGGCHSAFVQATVVNVTGAPIKLFEVDYPSASFGSGELAPGAQFHYKFKVLGSGIAKVAWTDNAGQEHTGQGPALHDGQEGSISITLAPQGAVWNADLHGTP